MYQSGGPTVGAYDNADFVSAFVICGRQEQKSSPTQASRGRAIPFTTVLRASITKLCDETGDAAGATQILNEKQFPYQTYDTVEGIWRPPQGDGWQATTGKQLQVTDIAAEVPLSALDEVKPSVTSLADAPSADSNTAAAPPGLEGQELCENLTNIFQMG